MEFKSEDESEASGYHLAVNCPIAKRGDCSGRASKCRPRPYREFMAGVLVRVPGCLRNDLPLLPSGHRKNGLILRALQSQVNGWPTTGRVRFTRESLSTSGGGVEPQVAKDYALPYLVPLSDVSAHKKGVNEHVPETGC